MPKKSAGILLFRGQGDSLEVLLVHPGGPFWAKKDERAWSIPKGEFEAEDPLEAARRELAEETGAVAAGTPIPLAPIRQAGGKWVHGFALAQAFDPAELRSHTFTMEWPPRSGLVRAYPEVDRAEWFSLPVARLKIVRGQVGFLEQLAGLMSVPDTRRA